MSDQSTNLSMPYLAASQAQKHVTVNQAVQRLDALVQLSVVSATIAAQPASPGDGARYILPPGKTGADWGGMANGAIAYYVDGAWQALTPAEGWAAYVRDSDTLLIHDGSAWSVSAAFLGAANRFTAKQEIDLQAGGAPSDLAGTVLRLENADSAGTTICLDAYGSALLGQIAIRRAGGVKASPSAMPSGQGMASLSAIGYGATGWQSNLAASIMLESAEAFTDAAGGSDIRFRTTPNGSVTARDVLYLGQDGAAYPGADNAFSCGKASFRWSVVYAGTGTINTSDAAEKSALQPVPPALKRAMKRILPQIGVFQWKAALAEKGEEKARLHIGLTAQSVRDAFAAEGEDSSRWALFCADRTETGEERLGLRYDQFFALALACLA